MSVRKKTAAAPAIERAAVILRRIAAMRAAIAQLTCEYQKRIEAVKKSYEGEIAEGNAELKRLDKEIRKLLKKEKASIFPKADSRVETAAGSLLYTIQKRARQVKGMLKTLEKMGREDLMKISKSADWDAIDKLDDEELKQIGTFRDHKEIFAYEVKEGVDE